MNWGFQVSSYAFSPWSMLPGIFCDLSCLLVLLMKFLQATVPFPPFFNWIKPRYPSGLILGIIPSWNPFLDSQVDSVPSSSFPVHSIPLSYSLASFNWNDLLWEFFPLSLEFQVLMGGFCLYLAFSPLNLVKSLINVFWGKLNGQKLVSNKRQSESYKTFGRRADSG